MTIKREDIVNRRVDLSDVVTGRRLPPVRPEEILRDEFLNPLEMSVYDLARAIKVSRLRLNDLVRGHRAITTDTALRPGGISGRRLSSGSTCRPATISMPPSAPCATSPWRMKESPLWPHRANSRRWGFKRTTGTCREVVRTMSLKELLDR